MEIFQSADVSFYQHIPYVLSVDNLDNPNLISLMGNFLIQKFTRYQQLIPTFIPYYNLGLLICNLHLI